MNPSHLFKGKLIRLTEIREGDVAEIGKWQTNIDFMRQKVLSPAYPFTAKASRERLDNYISKRNAFNFAIRLLDNEMIIGLVTVSDIEWNHAVGQLGIGIGDSRYHGRGYGTEAVALLLDYVFRELNLYRIELTVFGYNASAIRIYEKLGFTHEATYREAIHRDGERYNVLLYGILRPEWERVRDSFI